MEDTKKIVFAGLDFSGKTSIILTLNDEYSKLQNLKPTMGVETRTDKILGMTVSQWDIGGQERFRKQFIKEKSHFENTDLLCYVIDVMDYSQDRILEAIDYFKQILQVFNYFKFTPKIVIFLHKIDPDIHSKEDIRTNIEKIKNEILKIDEVQDKKFEIEFFETSIYNKWSLFNAFSFGIRSLSTKTKTLTNILEDFAKKTESKSIILKDDNLLTIGEYFEQKIYETIIEKFALSLIFAYKDLKKSTLKDFSKMMLEMDDEYMFIQKIIVNEIDFYLILISASRDIQKLIKKSLSNLIAEIQEVISAFFTMK